MGHVRETFAGRGINGPWDMTSADFGRAADLFVTNVLNGTVAAKGATVHRGTVVRILLIIRPGRLPFILRRDTIGSGFGEHLDPAALVIGPTGVGLGRNGTLYVADTVANRIAAIPRAVFRVSDAGRGSTVSQGHALLGELGLVVAPGGDILTVNGGNGNLVEVSPFGTPGRGPRAGRLRLAAGRRRAVRPGGQAAPPRRLLRGRRHQHLRTPPLERSSRRPGPRPDQGARRLRRGSPQP